ncbi:MAG: DNA methyltransferase, partial [Gammaproteobacteria bacterium]|nr:DNA methyltransferase [Gammaproteobacteria bacterium]
RLIECRRVLKQSGSIYLHCDPTMSHYIKSTIDCLFGEDNFRNEIIWHYRKWTNAITHFQKNHDVILFYVKGGNGRKKPVFNRIMVDPTASQAAVVAKGYNVNKVNGVYQLLVYDKKKVEKLVGTGKLDLSKYGAIVDRDGQTKTGANDVWDIQFLHAHAKERTGYPTQKPLALLERIIQASSNEGDIVLDPFAGCATTCVAAERLNRQWIGVDISIKAYELVKERLTKEAADPEDLLKYQNAIHLKTDPPQRTDQKRNYREQKYVYVISHPNYPGEYKVGIAKNWKLRLNAYQTSDPGRQYKLEYKLETPWFRETEKYIHDILPNKHEWVQGTLDEITEAIRTHKPTHTEQGALNLA